METIKINYELATKFKELRNQSNEPTFNISKGGEVTYGCKVIEETENAVFVHCSGYLWCGAFWMPKSTYNTLENGFINGNKHNTNYDNRIFRY